MHLQVDICVPLYNEEKNLPLLIDNYKKARAKSPRVGRLILVDNGSIDDTWKLLTDITNSDILIFSLEKNTGYGGGATCAILNSISPMVALIPANNQYSFGRIIELIEIYFKEIQIGNKNLLVKGKRIGRSDPLLTRILSSSYTFMVSIIVGKYVRDVNGLPKIFDKTYIAGKIDKFPVNASFDGILLYELKRAGVNFLELPILYSKRKYGQASWTHNKISISLGMLKEIFRYRFKR